MTLGRTGDQEEGRIFESDDLDCDASPELYNVCFTVMFDARCNLLLLYLESPQPSVIPK